MQTVDKAMKLLNFFSPALPEIGLSELARLADFDKAATRRYLVALGNHGFIEQNLANTKYRLGSAFLRFSRIREITLPLSSIVQPILDKMAKDTGETAHASIISNQSLMTIGVAEPQRSTRVYVDPSQPLPLHATASGLAYLAFSEREVVDDYLANGRLKKITAQTTVSHKDLRLLIANTRKQGFGKAARSFEDEVIGTAAPLFDWSGKPFGTIAVASVASRFTNDTERTILASVLVASIAVTRATGAESHPNILAAIERLNK